MNYKIGLSIIITLSILVISGGVVSYKVEAC